MNENLKVLDEIRLNFSQDGILVLNITLAFIMFGVALGIKIDNFKEILKKPKIVIIGFISQFFILPAITFVVVLCFKNMISPTIAMGMILVAACPGGNISNFMTSLAKGNAALSVTLTAFATMAALVMTPLNFDIYGGLYNNIISNASNELLQPLKINPNKMFQAVLVLLGIPLFLGMLFNYFFPKTTKIINTPLKIASIAIFFGIVGILLAKNAHYFLVYIKYIFLIVLAHNLIGFLSGYLFAKVWKIRGANRRAITIETGIQNSGLALALLFNVEIFPVELNNGGMAFIAAWWGIWHILSGLTLAFFWSRKTPVI